MLGTCCLEHTNFINSGLTWMGSKGNRSSSRQAKKSAPGSLKGCRELLNQNLKTVDMPVCESEKLGVSVLGCRFTEKAEHVPIKKRRFVYRSPSPPPRAPSPHSEKADMHLKIKPGLIDCAASANELGPIVDKECDVDETNLEKVKVQVNDNEDFSGISILAAAACSKGFGGEDDHAENGSGIEESSVRDGPFDCSTNNELLSLSKGVSKDDLSSAEISAEETVSCVSALPAEATAACMRTRNSTAIGLSHKKNMEDTCVQDHPVGSKDLLTSKDEATIRKQGSSSLDDRLNWDLNSAMDSWEHLSECQVADSNANVSDGIAENVEHDKHCDKMRNFEGYELPNDLGDSKTEAVEELPPSDFREMSNERTQSNIEDHKLSVSANSKRCNFVEETLLSSELDHPVKVDEFEGKQPLHSPEIINSGAGSVFVLAEGAKRLSASINEDQSTSDDTISFGCAVRNEDSSVHGIVSLYSSADKNVTSKSHNHKTSCVADADMLTSSGSQVAKQEVGCLVPSSGSTVGGVGDGLNKIVADVKEIPSSLDGTSTAMDIVMSDAGQQLKTCIDNVTESQSCSATQGSEVPCSTAPVESQPAVAVDLVVQHDKASVRGSAETVTSACSNGEQPATKCVEKSTEMFLAPLAHSSHGLCRSTCSDLVDSSDRMSLEEPLDDYYSDVSHDHAHMKSSELEADYDSQYEDGEVRESVINNWEEYDDEDVEVEHVDYGSDNTNNLSCEAEQTMKHAQKTNFQPSVSGSSGSGKERSLKGKGGRNEVESGCDAGTGGVSQVDIAREVEIEKPSLSADSTMKILGQDPRTFSDSMIGVGDGGSRRNITDDSMFVMATEGTKTRMVGSREFKRELRSRIEGRALQDACCKKGKTCMQGSSDTDNTYPRRERVSGYVESFGRLRYTHHAHARGEEADRWINSADSHRGLKRYRSPHYHVPASFRRPGPENSCSGRQKMDASSHSVHLRLARSGLPADDRNEAFRSCLGFRPSRELSPGRRMTLSRGRSLRYGSRMDERGLRGRYYGPLPDDCSGPSLNHSHPSVKRDRSLSRIERRGEDFACKSHSKSPLRSRICSPDCGNRSLALRSKSPCFRSEVRMQRGRSPYQRSGFVADRMVGFRTMRRNHSSPPHNSRWIGDWKDSTVHFRGQARFGLRDDRFDFLDTPRNYRSVHTGRLLEVDGSGRGRPRCDGSDDNREKHSHRFGLVPPVERYDVDGSMKRFHYNVDESFVKSRNSRYGDGGDFYGTGSPKQFGRGIESLIGVGPRRFIEERGPFIHQRDEKHNSNPKSSGMRESDDEKASMYRVKASMKRPS